MKKIISLFTIVLLFAVTTFAQNATLTIGQATANVGEPVTIPVSLPFSPQVLQPNSTISFKTLV